MMKTDTIIPVEIRKAFSAMFVFSFFFLAEGYAQKGINSIYSAYGIGDYNLLDRNAYSGMGGVGVALKSDKSLNLVNPASFSAISNNKFMFDLSFSGSSVRYINENGNRPAGDFDIGRAAIGFNLIKPIGTVFGLQRYSNVEYFTVTTKDIAGTTDKLRDEINGTGGLNQLFLGNAVTIKKHLSLGITAGYIFGSVNTHENISNDGDVAIQVDNNKYYNNANINGGIQYSFKTKKYNWILGAFYEPSVSLKTLTDSKVMDAAGTILSTSNSIDGRFAFPSKYGFGASVKKDKITISADYIQQNWQSTGYKGSNFIATDAQSFSAGIGYGFTRHTIWGDFEGPSIYAGYNRQSSYLIIDDQQLISQSFSVGFTLPSKNNLHHYSGAIRVGSRGKPVYPLVKENFVDFIFNISLSSYLQKGGRKYD